MGKTEKKKALPLIKGSQSFKLYIPKEVEAKIRHLCSVIHNVEWSGTLFYRSTGSFEQGTFEVTCVDLFVMDIGSSGYTEYNDSPDIVTYRIDHNLLGSDIQEGLIHSHNTFSAFFSGTDRSTLVEEGTNSNHFVSLIVNNAGQYVAAVTRKVVTEEDIVENISSTTTKYYNTYGGNRVMLADNEETNKVVSRKETSKVIESFDFEVIKESADNDFEELDKRLNEIRTAKNTPVKSSYPAYTSYWDDLDYGYYGLGKYKEQSLFNDDDLIVKNDKKEPKIEEIKTPKSRFKADPNDDTMYDPLIYEMDNDIVKDTAIKLLTGCIIVNSKTFNIEEWVQKMDTVYEKHFGPLNAATNKGVSAKTIEANNKKLEEWLDMFTEYLCYNTEDPELIKKLAIERGAECSTDDTVEICALDLYLYFDTLPNSHVKDVIMKSLLNYIPDELLELI